jgi:hypothetical protein
VEDCHTVERGTEGELAFIDYYQHLLTQHVTAASLNLMLQDLQGRNVVLLVLNAQPGHGHPSDGPHWRSAVNTVTRAALEPAIWAALSLAKKTLKRYYNLTDNSEVYRIAMGMFSLLMPH